MTTTKDFIDELVDGIYEMEYLCTDPDNDGPDLFSKLSLIRTFDEAGLDTNDQGIVVALADGSEFQLTVTKRS